MTEPIEFNVPIPEHDHVTTEVTTGGTYTIYFNNGVEVLRIPSNYTTTWSNHELRKNRNIMSDNQQPNLGSGSAAFPSESQGPASYSALEREVWDLRAQNKHLTKVLGKYTAMFEETAEELEFKKKELNSVYKDHEQIHVQLMRRTSEYETLAKKLAEFERALEDCRRGQTQTHVAIKPQGGFKITNQGEAGESLKEA